MWTVRILRQHLLAKFYTDPGSIGYGHITVLNGEWNVHDLIEPTRSALHECIVRNSRGELDKGSQVDLASHQVRKDLHE